jgi:hypothetical protein
MNASSPFGVRKRSFRFYGVSAVTQLSFRLNTSISKAVASPPRSKEGEHLFGAMKFDVIAPMV